MHAQAKNILVVDDLPMNRKLLRTMLEAEGYNTSEAADGAEALALLERQPVAAVISDILMPRMDGYRFCFEVRKSEKHKSLPVIIYTSTHISPGDERCALDFGADKYIRRPAPAQIILEALDGLLSSKREADIRPVQLELEVMKEYNEALIRKLREKNIELEQTQGEITRANHQLELRVQERTEELEEANLELETFGRAAAHDLRNPLTTILAFTELLQGTCSDKLDENEKQYLQAIADSAGRMGDLILDLLNLSLGTGSPLNRTRVDLSALAGEVFRKLQAASPGRIVELIIAPHVIVDADPHLLQIAVENLLGNAWKFSGKKQQARIEFGAEPHDGRTRCFVRDNGAGFDMAQAERLFGAFQRLHTSADFPGTGIGLTTVQRIIRRHGGRIWAESAKDQGTTFFFIL
jgi:two-component system, sensor histidine kinase and response regulator